MEATHVINFGNLIFAVICLLLGYVLIKGIIEKIGKKIMDHYKW